MLLIVLGCAQEPLTAAGASFDSFVGEVGTFYEYAAADDPHGVAFFLQADEGTWTLNEGDEWPTSEEVGAWTVTEDSGLWVDGQQLLTDPLEAGESGEGMTVVSRDEVTVYYGTFSDAATIAVDSGAFAGTWIFARDTGPILITFDGVERELRSYE